jgi:hypothetical protein
MSIVKLAQMDEDPSRSHETFEFCPRSKKSSKFPKVSQQPTRPLSTAMVELKQLKEVPNTVHESY